MDELTALGFGPPAPVDRRLFISVAGWPKQGKSHFALTGRPPVALFDLNDEHRRIAHKFDPPPFVSVIGHPTAYEGGNREVWQRQWRLFVRQWEECYRLGVGTVIVDSWSEVYELARLSRFGKLTQVMPHQYGELNTELSDLLQVAARSKDTDTVLIERLRSNFENGNPEPVGWKSTHYRTEINLTADPLPPDGGVGSPDFGFIINESSHNAHTVGMRIPQAQANLEYLRWVSYDWRPDGN